MDHVAGGVHLSGKGLLAELEHVRRGIKSIEVDSTQSGERLIDSLAERMQDGFSVLNPEGVHLDVNAALCLMTGYAREELIGVGPPHPYWAPEERQRITDGILSGLTRVPSRAEATFMRKDGERFPVLITPTVMLDADCEPICIYATIKDVSELKHAEEALEHLNRELRAISNCNQALLRAAEEETLLEDICRIVCDEAGYRMAWVGYAEHDDARSVRPVAWAGVEDGYLAAADVSWADDVPRGRGPTGTCVRTGRVVLTQGYPEDPGTEPWREDARQRGYRSSIALPLQGDDGGTFGALNIYSAEPGVFTPEEVRLLEELAGDLAFGITVLRARAEREQTLQALRESENHYRSLFEDSPIAIWAEDDSMVKAHLEELAASGVEDVIAHVLADPEEHERCIALSRNVDVNQAALRLFEAESREQLMARNSDLYRRQRDRGIHNFWAAMLAGESSATFEEENLSLRGKELHILETCTVVPGHEETFDRVYVADVDISEQRRAKEAVRDREERLRHAFDATVAALGATVAMRDPYTADHERRVAELVAAIAARLAWSSEAIEELRIAALVHDIGKIGVPAEILTKPTRLTDGEFELIKGHPAAAYEILAAIEFDGPVAETVYQHHERLDGSGYPRGLRGGEILPAARVLAVADVVEAMITHRPYRAALPLEAALAEIGPDSRGRFDAEAAEVCRRLFEDEGFRLPE